jgi:hypothetical protein
MGKFCLATVEYVTGEFWHYRDKPLAGLDNSCAAKIPRFFNGLAYSASDLHTPITVAS